MMTAVIFVRGSKGNTVDRVIDDVSRGEFSHVAIKILDSIVEALGEPDLGDKYPGVWAHNPEKYDGADVEVVPVELPDLPSAEAEARSLIGTFYGYTDCIRGGLYDLTGVTLQGNKFTANCSETVTRILRAGGLDVLPGVPPDCITPNDLYRAVTA
jgi:hypothetical protein